MRLENEAVERQRFPGQLLQRARNFVEAEAWPRTDQAPPLPHRPTTAFFKFDFENHLHPPSYQPRPPSLRVALEIIDDLYLELRGSEAPLWVTSLNLRYVHPSKSASKSCFIKIYDCIDFASLLQLFPDYENPREHYLT